MHPQAAEWIASTVTLLDVMDGSVIDLGGRDVNGTVHGLFKQRVTVLDALEGPDVDIVADAAMWTPGRLYDVALCTEVFEHTPDWACIIRTAWCALEDGGVLIATCATNDRPPHSAVDGGALRPGEFYENISPEQYGDIIATMFTESYVGVHDGVFGNDDLYCWAVK